MTGSDPKPEDVFDVERIRSLIALMKEHDLSEIDLRQDEQQIRLCRGTAGVVSHFVAPPAPTAAPAAAPAPAKAEKTADAEAHIAYVRSPMVGTFYSRPNPNAEPFVKVGDYVDESKTVCIVEAMKVFNEIAAEVRGKIVAVLVRDEDPVDFGKPLFKVDTSI